MSTGVISVVLAGHTLPDAYIKSVLEECPEAFTIVKVEDGKFVVARLEAAQDYDLELCLNEALKKDLDKNLVIYHDKTEKLPGEQQPFDLLTKDNEPILLAMCEGTCEKYDTDEAQLSPEAEMLTEWFGEQVSILYAQCNKDLKKTIDLLDTATFRTKLEEHLAPRGTIVIFTNTDIIRFLAFENAAYGEFGWGYTTNVLGYSEKPEGTPPTDGGKPQITLKELEELPFKKRQAKLQELGFKNLKEAAAALEGQVTESSTEDLFSSIAVDKALRADIVTDNGTISFPEKDGAVIFPPPKLKGRGLLRWYEKHLDHKGERNTERAVRVQLKTTFENAPAIPISNLAGSSHFLRVIHGTDKPSASQSDRKDTAPHHLPNANASGVVENLSAMSPDEIRRAVNARVKQKEIGPITQEQLAAPSKVQSFCERLSTDDDPCTVEEVLCWQTFKQVAADKNSAEGLLEDFRRFILMNNPNLLKKIADAASKAAAGTEVSLDDLPYKERQALRSKKAAG